jgi:hypothetical protein
MKALIGSISHKLMFLFNISLNIVMSFESNSGSIYYPLSCGIPSDPGIDIESNNFSGYLYKEPNDFILWGQEDYYPHPQTNINSTIAYYSSGSQTNLPFVFQNIEVSGTVAPQWNDYQPETIENFDGGAGGVFNTFNTVTSIVLILKPLQPKYWIKNKTIGVNQGK